MPLIRVCVLDEKLGAKPVTIAVDGKRYVKDLCDDHIAELLEGAQEIKSRGRTPGSGAGTSARGGSTRKKSA